MAGPATLAHELLMGDLQRNAPASTGSELSTLGYEYAENAGATVLGAEATVRFGSRSVVCEDVLPVTLVAGVPTTPRELPEPLDGGTR